MERRGLIICACAPTHKVCKQDCSPGTRAGARRPPRCPSENSNGDSAQIGELLYQIIPAAYTQAVSQALGITIDCLPLQTDSLYKMLLAKYRKFEAMKMQKAQEKNNSEQEDAK